MVRAGQAAGDIIGRICIACWINKSTDTHSQYVILRAFIHGIIGYARVLHCYVIRTFTVLLLFKLTLYSLI